jgi:dTDP-glucose 4,6-dehydratase
LNWNGKRVLVTGAGGFIGSHLAERLVELGASTRALVHYNALGTWGWLDQSPFCDEIEVVAGDIRDRDSVLQTMQEIEIVFHLAALIAIPYSYHAPASYIRTNVEGTLNILQGAREKGLELVVHTSTSEVYGTAQYVPIDEAHPLQGQSPYSASKIGADKIAEAYHLSFDLPVVTLRPFNTYGPRQSARAVIPTIITQCLDGDSIHLGNIHPTRDLTYVADTVEGFLLAASTTECIGKTINLGAGQEITIDELARLIAKLMGRQIELQSEEQRVRPRLSEVDRLVADNSVARRIFGWEPAVSLEEGLNRTIEWMKEHLSRYRPNAYSI